MAILCCVAKNSLRGTVPISYVSSLICCGLHPPSSVIYASPPLAMLAHPMLNYVSPLLSYASPLLSYVSFLFSYVSPLLS